MTDLLIIGAGLAGSEAAWQAAENGLKVTLNEMRPVQKTDAHHTENCAELVCSNSFRSDDDEHNAVGLLHWELRQGKSLIMQCADANKLPAGGALAVDRDEFSKMVTAKLEAHPNITICREEIKTLPSVDAYQQVIVATGPLTSEALSQDILKITDEEGLSFFDAIAPIVYKESINLEKAWFQSRYDKGDGKDYINCAMDKAQYENFIHELISAPTSEFKEWEKNTPYFEGCLPIEIMAARGPETLRYGPMKPVGLTNPHINEKSYAIVQLRQDNKQATLWNIVGFQTKIKYGDQSRILKLIPGLEDAEFARLGGIHRNTFINSPKLLDETLRLKKAPHLRFAGQITGVEGYLESAACGFMAGRFATSEIKGEDFKHFPRVTALGALIAHVTGEAMIDTFQPMNVNFGLFPELELTKRVKGRDRKKLYTERAKAALSEGF